MRRRPGNSTWNFRAFTVDWEHRFEEDLPLYMQISKDDCIIHLSEHYGSGSPGAAIRIETSRLESFQKKLLAKRLRGRKLFSTSRDDLDGRGVPRLEMIRRQYERAPDPKELIVLVGSAHAHFIFETDQGEPLMREILRFLSAP